MRWIHAHTQRIYKKTSSVQHRRLRPVHIDPTWHKNRWVSGIGVTRGNRASALVCPTIYILPGSVGVPLNRSCELFSRAPRKFPMSLENNRAIAVGHATTAVHVPLLGGSRPNDWLNVYAVVSSLVRPPYIGLLGLLKVHKISCWGERLPVTRRSTSWTRYWTVSSLWVYVW